MMLYDVHDVCTSICESKSHKVLVPGLHDVPLVSTLLKLVGSTCPSNSNQVLRDLNITDLSHKLHSIGD